MIPFRRRLTPEQRRSEKERITHHCTDRVPVIVEVGSRETPQSDREKFLVPCDLTAAQFIFVLRKRIRLTPRDALFLLVDNAVPKATTTMKELYDRHAEEDGFLYVTYTTESTFG